MDGVRPSEISLSRAVEILVSGGVVAFPTETTWGLAVDPANPGAMAALFALKQRPFTKPVPCVIGDIDQVGELAAAVPDLFSPLIQRFWPGPLTLLFPARIGLLQGLSDARGLAGMRLSSHPLARALPLLFGTPLTATSANPGSKPPALAPADIHRYFGDAVAVVSSDICPGGRSTIVSVESGRIEIFRRGAIKELDLRSVST